MAGQGQEGVVCELFCFQRSEQRCSANDLNRYNREGDLLISCGKVCSWELCIFRKLFTHIIWECDPQQWVF
jgi:hypothetical protein